MSDETLKQVTDILEEKHTCYVLITCDQPSSEGKMNVQMNYAGDPVLAAYLLQGAQNFLEEQEEEEPSFIS